MALNPISSPPCLETIRFRAPTTTPPLSHLILLADVNVCKITWPRIRIVLRKGDRCVARSAEVEKVSEQECLVDDEALARDGSRDAVATVDPPRTMVAGDSSVLGIREPVYEACTANGGRGEVVEVKPSGMVSRKKINRRHLLKSSGLHPRDIRSIDPSLWLTNSVPSLLVREHAIRLNLGSLRAIAMSDRVLIFNCNRRGVKALIDTLLPRLQYVRGGPCMPFELEVLSLLEVLPHRLMVDVLEELRLSKQTLVELGSRAGALKQMLLDLLEDPQ